MNMENMRSIVEAELENTNALNCIWGKIPEEDRKDLVDLVLQKMSWAAERKRNEVIMNRDDGDWWEDDYDE